MRKSEKFNVIETRFIAGKLVERVVSHITTPMLSAEGVKQFKSYGQFKYGVDNCGTVETTALYPSFYLVNRTTGDVLEMKPAALSCPTSC